MSTGGSTPRKPSGDTSATTRAIASASSSRAQRTRRSAMTRVLSSWPLVPRRAPWVYSDAEMSDGSPFDARCDRREDAAVVAVSGELDLDSAEKLRALLLSPP